MRITRRSLLKATPGLLIPDAAIARPHYAGGVGAAPATGTNLVTSVTFGGNQQNNYAFPLGMSITIGSQPITVTAIGRYAIAGHSNLTHTLYLLDPTISIPAVGGALTGVVAGWLVRRPTHSSMAMWCRRRRCWQGTATT
jgi:hypothetical protein